jgi:SulP family sulfate permease
MPEQDELTTASSETRDSGPPSQAYAGDRSFQKPEPAPLLHRAVPVSAELPAYRTHKAKRDIVAGLTVAALAVPAAMAYAELAGLSPVRGLYALLLPTVAYALLGSSRQLIIGPEGSISALVAAAVLPLAVAGSPDAGELAAMLALLVAACFLVARVIRLGWLADYFSRAVLIGYIHGVVVVLIVGQLGKLLGLDIETRDPLPQLAEIGRELGSVHGLTVAVGLIALAGILVLRHVAPRFPALLVIVVAGMAVSWALALEDHGVAVVGSIPAGLPSFEIPLPAVHDVFLLLPAAVGIFAVSFADEILTARSFAGKNGQQVRASQELLSMGAANAAAGLTQGFPIGASGSRTAVNDSMGARTQVAGLVGAGAIVLILLFLTAPIEYLPKAVLGAVIIAAALGLVDLAAWRGLWATDRFEVTIAAVTVAGVVVVGVLESLIFAVGLAILDTVRRSARPHDAVLGWVDKLGRYGDVAVHKSARVTPGILVYRLDDRIFFANARYVKGRVGEALHAAPSHTDWLVFDAEALTHIDATGSEALIELTTSLRNDGVQLVLARLKEGPKRRFDEAGLTNAIGEERFYPTVRAAVDAYAHTDGAARH